MITIEQLKDVKERTEALYRYLDVEGKKIQVEEEQLRTQAPGFWDDQKAAEAQMKKVKALQQWITGYQEVRHWRMNCSCLLIFIKMNWLPRKKWMRLIQKLSLQWKSWN